MPADLVTRLLLQNSEFDRNLKASQAQIQSFEKRVGVMGASVESFVAGFAGMAGVSFAFQDAVQKSMAFEKSLSSLRALTGVSAKELDFFKQEAIKMGSTSTQSASQVVDAFKLIGSQSPELLKNKDALAEVTKQAIILAEAAEMDVPEAARALTGSLNQMGESTSKAGEYINILAAASQAGSADIPYLTKAIERSGGAASSVGIKYNELVAAIEAIAPKVTEASEAGISLRNIFLKLESSSDKNLKPSVVGLTTALENLAAKNYDATQMTKMFGEGNVTAALAIVNAKDKYNEYKEVITGTNTALEQQKLNNDNLAGSLKSASSAWEGFVLTLNNSNGALQHTAEILTVILGRMTDAMKSETQKQNELIQEGVKEKKKSLNQEIEAWMVLGDRKKAIMETMRQLDLKNPEAGKYNVDLDTARNKLYSLQAALKKTKSEQQTESGLDVIGKQITGLPNVSTSYADVFDKKTLEENIKAQQEVVDTVEMKNELYKQSLQYLKDELVATEKINEKAEKPDLKAEIPSLTKAEKGRRVKELQDIKDIKPWISDEIQKVAFPEPIAIPVTLTEYDIEKELDRLNDLAKGKGEIIKLELSDKEMGNLRTKIAADIHVPVIPEFVESDETGDISGSISDYQQKIQDVTLAYNEATTDGLRSLYAKQREDLEEHLQGMTDMNQGMIDISNELNQLIQSGVVSGFESLGEAIASGDPGEAMRNMLIGLMDMLKQFGVSLVAAGLAKIAFDKLLANPYAAIAAGGALIIATTIAKSSLNKVGSAGSYAEGGVVPRTLFTVGDRMTANVNGGEMWLTTGQQAKLFDLLDLGRTNNNNEREITGRLVAEGSQLVAVIDSTMKKQRRGR